jgi:hypothetical protein
MLNTTDYIKTSTVVSCTEDEADTYLWKSTTYGTYIFKVLFTEAFGHDYSHEETVATCDTQGYTVYTCSRCDYSYTDNYIAPLGHSYENELCINCGVAYSEENFVNPFVDVEGTEYYYMPVMWAAQQGITKGTSDTTFAPKEPCTRGQVVTFLWRAFGSPEPTLGENPFQDVEKDAYYYKAVLSAVEKGITTGTSVDFFSPESICTRGQVATFLWRAQGMPHVETAKNPFTDMETDAYYYQAVLWAVEQKITDGTGNHHFSPYGNCTRGQIVTFLYRTMH